MTPVQLEELVPQDLTGPEVSKDLQEPLEPQGLQELEARQEHKAHKDHLDLQATQVCVLRDRGIDFCYLLRV